MAASALTPPADRRVEVVDGLRGVAVLLVVVFHFLARWPEHYPFEDMFVDFEPARSGFAGVDLFFIISGFVIARSLTGSRGFIHFAAKRMDRLVLPMLVLSSVAFALLSGPLRTAGFEQRWSNFIPSWTFTKPGLWSFLDPDVSYIDLSYWTLFIEVRFYLIIALLWFLAPRGQALRIFAIGACLSPALLYLMVRAGGRIGALDLPVDLFDLFFFPSYAPLFAAGALYSRVFEKAASRLDLALLFLLIPIGCVAPIMDADPDRHLAIIVTGALFHAVFLSLAFGARWVEIFTFRPLIWAGLISYSLYLLHQNIGVALISRIPPELPLVVQLLGVVAVMALTIAAAACSWLLLERRRLFSGLLARLVQFRVTT